MEGLHEVDAGISQDNAVVESYSVPSEHTRQTNTPARFCVNCESSVSSFVLFPLSLLNLVFEVSTWSPRDGI